MSYRAYIVKRVLPSFFVSVSFISAALAILGVIFLPNQQFGYEGFCFPLLFGAIAALPQLVMYSKKELPTKRMLLRKCLHLALLEAIILLFNYLNGARYGGMAMLSLVLSILIIDVAVQLVLWLNDKRIAKDFNESLKAWQDDVEKSMTEQSD